MGNLIQVSDDNYNLIMDIATQMGIENYISIRPIGFDKNKTLIKVQKATPTTVYIGKCPDTVCIFVYEAAFDRLSENQKKMLVSDALSTVNYDPEKEKIKIGAPSITVTLWGRAKYGENLLNAAEAGVLAIAQIEEEEKERRAAEKLNKKSKK